jgi:hypothetical protein
MMPTVPEPPRISSIEELPSIAVAGVNWRPVRRELDVRAFGVNAYTADAGELLIEDHDETGDGAGGHEELYVVVSGRARFTIDGAEHDAPAGTLVFLPDAASQRSAVAVDDGTSALAVGGRPGAPYTVSAWETMFVGLAAVEAGDPGKAADLMTGVIDQYPGNVSVRYNAACFEALAGRRSEALAHLREAAAIDADKVRRWAADDRDLDSLRDDPAFPRL